MPEDLRALLIPPQEAKLRSRFGLVGVTLRLITSVWHRLVVAGPDRVFAFPRHQGEAPMLEREADVLSALDLAFDPRLLGLHRDDGVAPYPGDRTTRSRRRCKSRVFGAPVPAPLIEGRPGLLKETRLSTIHEGQNPALPHASLANIVPGDVVCLPGERMYAPRPEMVAFIYSLGKNRSGGSRARRHGSVRTRPALAVQDGDRLPERRLNPDAGAGTASPLRQEVSGV
jgi:hypothetical protein